jgi:hypothetical protein
MLSPLEQVQNCELSMMEEIPDTFFGAIEANADYGFHLFPNWFEEERGLRRDGLYALGQTLFNLIKGSGREADIVLWYEEYKNIEEHSQNTATVINYLTGISQDLHDAARKFFTKLYNSFDSQWFTNYTNSSVKKYIGEFKRSNDVYVCPICFSESITHGKKEARSALDHWFCKAKYPFLGVYLNNLIPMGNGCNNPPRKGEHELIYTDDTRAQRQEFYYPYVYGGVVTVGLRCLREPNDIDEDFGDWLFEFTGVDAPHQLLVNRWNSFFEISDRWIENILEVYILSWTKEVKNMLLGENLDIDNDDSYNQAIRLLQISKGEFTISHTNRVEWFFLGFLLNGASEGLYEGYRAIVKEHLDNE